MPVVWFIFESFDRLASGLLVSIADFIFENVISGDTEGRRAVSFISCSISPAV